MPQNSEISINQGMFQDRIFELDSEEEDGIPRFVKQIKRSVINTHVGTAQVSLPSGILTFKF